MSASATQGGHNNRNALLRNESILPVNPFKAAYNETFRRVSI